MICDIDDLPLHYESYGEGRPVVFLPRWGDDLSENRELHEPVFAERPGWQRIYLDPPGHGRTPARPWIDGLGGMLDIVLRFLDEVVGDRRFVVAGASAGGVFARGLVRHHPARVDGVLLRVPGVILDPARRTLPTYQPLIADPSVAAGLEPPPLVQTADYVAAYLSKKERFYDPAEKAADLPFLTGITADLAGADFDVDDLPAPCGAPTLIVTGRQDINTGVRRRVAAAAELPARHLRSPRPRRPRPPHPASEPLPRPRNRLAEPHRGTPHPLTRAASEPVLGRPVVNRPSGRPGPPGVCDDGL